MNLQTTDASVHDRAKTPGWGIESVVHASLDDGVTWTVMPNMVSVKINISGRPISYSGYASNLSQPDAASTAAVAAGKMFAQQFTTVASPSQGPLLKNVKVHHAGSAAASAALSIYSSQGDRPFQKLTDLTGDLQPGRKWSSLHNGQ